MINTLCVNSPATPTPDGGVWRRLEERGQGAEVKRTSRKLKHDSL